MADLEDQIPERENKIIKEEFVLGDKFIKFKKSDLGLEQQTQMNQLSQKEREKLENANKETVIIPNLFEKHKVIVLYFGAQWSPPAQAFLPRLIKFYQEVNIEQPLMEIIYIPFDTSSKEYEATFREMPWLCLPFGDDRCKKYAKNYEVKGVPNLIVIRPDLKCVHSKAKLDVIKCLKEQKDPEDKFLEWCDTAQESEIIDQLLQKEKEELEQQKLQDQNIAQQLVGGQGNDQQ